MPYIVESRRELFDKNINELSKHIVTEGEMCYCIYRLVQLYCKKYKESGIFSFNIISQCITAMECAKLEFYRRIASPYEDKKIQENGDIE